MENKQATSRGGAVALFLALAIPWFGNIGVRTLSEPDEGRYAEIPREMLATGDWVVPRLNGMQYLEKPPLQYWATAAFYSALGARTWVSRLWPTTLGFGVLALVYALGRRLYGESEARCAVLLLAGSPLFFAFGHINTLDMGLTFFLTAALAAFVTGLLAEPASPSERVRMRLGYLAVGLAVLQKGVVAFALPVVALVLYSLLARDRSVWRRLHWRSGGAIVLALNAPWWLLMQRRNPEFLEFFFVREHLVRFLTQEHDRGQPWWFFSAVLLGGTLPWTAPLARSVWRTWRDRPRSAEATDRRSYAADGLLLASAAAVFLFYSPSGSKLMPYLLPMLPPLALLGGRELARGRGLGASLALGAVLAAAMLGMRPWVRQLVPPGIQQDVLVQFSSWAVPAGIALGVCLAAASLLARLGDRERGIWTLGVGLVASLALVTCGTNALEWRRGGPSIAPVLARALDPDAPFYCVGMYLQSLPFALGRTCIAVDFKGELQVRFDDGEPNYIPTLDGFLDAWQHSQRGAAVVSPKSWERLQQMGIRARVLTRTPYAVAIARL